REARALARGDVVIDAVVVRPGDLLADLDRLLLRVERDVLHRDRDALGRAAAGRGGGLVRLRGRRLLVAAATPGGDHGERGEEEGGDGRSVREHDEERRASPRALGARG